MHSGQCPYSYHVCQKSFRQMCHLKQHVPTHTREHPCSCDVVDVKMRKTQLVMGLWVEAGPGIQSGSLALRVCL